MTEANRYIVYFTLTGDFDPREVTSALNLQPSETWKKGERNEQTHYERKFSRWSRHSKLPNDSSFEDQIVDVIGQLEPSLDSILRLKEVHPVQIQLVGYFYRNYPGLHFTPSLIAGLARFGVSLDFDFYYLYSNRLEDS